MGLPLSEKNLQIDDIFGSYDQQIKDLQRRLNQLETQEGTDGLDALATDTTEVSVSNSLVETTLFSFSVPANTLGTNRLLHFKSHLRVTSNSGVGFTLTLRIKYGATTIITIANPFANHTSGQLLGFLDVFLWGDGATNTQEAACYFDLVRGDGGFTENGSGEGTSAEDSTAAKTFEVTAQMSLAVAAFSVSSKAAALFGPYEP